MAQGNCKLTPATHKKIVAAFRNGHFHTAAARQAGVTGRTLTNWLARGQAEEGTIFSRLYADVEKANGEIEGRAVAWILQAAKEGQWQAAAWFLERRFRHEWSRTTQLEVSGPGGAPITFAELAALAVEPELELEPNGDGTGGR